MIKQIKRLSNGVKTRSFIAINLSTEIKNYLADIISELKKLNPNLNIKWVKPEGLHFTLHFLGYLDEQKLEKVKKIIGQSVGDSPSVEVELNDFGGFPNLNKPRVLFVGCQEIGNNSMFAGRQVLKTIQEKIGKQLKKINIEVDQRPWRMHITLGRLRQPKEIRNPKFKIRNLKFRVKSIDLMKSELNRTGAKYSIIKQFSLQPSL